MSTTQSIESRTDLPAEMKHPVHGELNGTTGSFLLLVVASNESTSKIALHSRLFNKKPISVNCVITLMSIHSARPRPTERRCPHIAQARIARMTVVYFSLYLRVKIVVGTTLGYNYTTAKSDYTSQISATFGRGMTHIQ